MTSVIRFENVSKKYHLGTTRTSFVKAIANFMKRHLSYASFQSPENQILWAVRDVSFELHRGESLALIGKNGAGKSTILKLLANITRPTSGKITVTGRLSALIELGSGFHGDLTGRENIFLNGAVIGLTKSEIKQRFDEIVAFSEIEDFLETPVKRYSSGMLVRLGFAVAACVEPEVLLVDEVLAVGDAAYREKCLLRIKALLDRGTSLIFVSHNINMVEAICTSALYIRNGKIEDRGNVGNVIASYERQLHEERAQKFEDGVKEVLGRELSGVKIERVMIIGRNGERPEHFLGSEPVEIRVIYNSERIAERVDGVLRIIRSDGLTCCMVRTANDNYPLVLNQGSGHFSVFLDPLQLNGGKYFVDVFISTPRDLVLLANKRSDWFYVRGATLSFEEQSGVFDPFRRWSHDPIEYP